MAVPEFYNFLRPALQYVNDHPGAYWKDVANHCFVALGLVEADREEVISSGQTKWENRSHWALTYLRQAKLIDKAGRGMSVITDRGRQYLAEAPQVIKPTNLLVFSEFAEFARGGKPSPNKAARATDQGVLLELTPQEGIARSSSQLRLELAESLLDQLKQVSPARFERIIVKLMLKLG